MKEFVAKNKELIVYGGIAVVFIVVLIFGIKLLKKIFKKDASDIAAAELNNRNLTYNNSWYATSVDSLYAAMKGPGTDEEAIYRIIDQIRTIDDWLKLVALFGKKDNETLPQWLTSELGSSECAKVNAVLNPLVAGI